MPPADLTEAAKKLEATMSSAMIGTLESMSLPDKKIRLEKTMKYCAILHGPDETVLGKMNCEIRNGSAEVTAQIDFPKITWVDKLKEWATPLLLLAILLKR